MNLVISLSPPGQFGILGFYRLKEGKVKPDNAEVMAQILAIS
jgi:hypothetical protein